ncbi:MAG: peroxiredoxin [Verrucomicrobiota bacterium]
MSSYPAVGSPAPAFLLPVVGGAYPEDAVLDSRSLTGRPYVLYFYPKDDTPGCTAQACALRDDWSSVSSKAAIFGVSIDSVRSHKKFITKHQLPFPLIADGEKVLATAYGVWVEKSLYGKTYMGTERSTFVIGADGKIAAILPKVKPAEHLTQLLAAL